MTGSTVLVSTWSDGLFVIEGGKVHQELAGRGVRGLAAGDDESVLAIVDTGKLCRRGRDGGWAQLAESQSPLSCCLISRGKVFVGTDDGAHLMRLDRDGALRRMEGFDATPGRDKWFAGAMLVDGKMMGPPLGIRSMSVSPDGGVLLANVHVGGIPRSTDRGVTWHPTIDIDADVHQVVCHASRPESVAAAAAAGLCISRDGGASWRIGTDGLHASHCSAVAFVGDDVFVSASESPFSKEGAVYRRPAGGAGPLTPVGGRLPRWTAGKVDTACIGVHGQSAAIVDSAGNVFLSRDYGRSWAREAEGPAGASCVLFI
jgi:hypothetical protein